MKNSTVADVQVFSEIRMFAEQIGITHTHKSENFLIYSFEQEKQIDFNNTMSYRQDYYELMIDITEGCSFSIDNTIIPAQKIELR